jgi:hypothetical protein
MRPRLAETQHYLWRLITAPEGVVAGLAAMREEDPRLASMLEEMIESDDRLSAVQRLDVYANMYFYRLLDNLKGDYPVLLAVLGEAAFHNLITDYLLAHPSSHPSLRHVGQHLPACLRQHPLAVARPWLADLAELEWTLVDVFDAADTPVLGTADLERLAPEDWADARFAPASSVRLLRLSWAVDDLWDRAQREEPTGDPDGEAIAVQVWRRDLRVYHRTLEPLERDCLTLLLAGQPFGAWCEHAAETVGEEAAASRVVALLRRWLDEGVLSALS